MKLSILSNMNFEFLEYLIKKEKWFKYFDNRVFSCEINLIKPDEEIYKFILKQISEQPENVLFIDDSESNILTAKKLGMNTIHFKNNHDVEKIIKENYNINIQKFKLKNQLFLPVYKDIAGEEVKYGQPFNTVNF